MSENSSIVLIAEQAVSARRASMLPYDAVTDVRALEALRAAETDEARQSVLDLVILERKRAIKGAAETVACRADLYDKAALPASAALPALFAVLDNSHTFPDQFRNVILWSGYAFAALIWVGCRWLNMRLASKARRDLADLGKVD